MSEIKNHEFHDDDFEFAHAEGEKLIDKTYKSTSYWKDVWGNFSKNKGALIGAVIICIIILFALIGPSLNEHTYKSINHGHEYLVPRIPGLEKIGIANGYYKGADQYAQKGASDVYYWFGTDTLATEHKLPSVMWAQEYQNECYEMNFRVMDDYDFVKGELVWNFADFQTTEGIMRVNGNKKGIFTRNRQPKDVAFLLKKRWEQK